MGVYTFRFHDVAHDAAGLRRIGDAVTLEDLVVGDPHPAARACGRAAVVRSLLDD